MRYIMHADLASRIERIRLPHSDLAERALVNKHTISRILTGSNVPLVSTIGKLQAALEAEELALRDYLIRLHGLPEALQPGAMLEAAE